MKIYLAARFTRNEQMQIVADLLTAQGHKVTSRWHTGAHKMDDGIAPDSGVGLEIAQRFAGEDLEDLMEATCVISFTEPARTPTRGGRHVEFGYGLAYQKKMIIVGEREHIFHYLPQVEQFEHVDALLHYTLGEAPKPRRETYEERNGKGLPVNEADVSNCASGALFNNNESGAARAIAGR